MTRIEQWLTAQGFNTEQMLPAEVDDLVIDIMSNTPLDHRARQEAEKLTKELLDLADQTIKIIRSNKDLLNNPHVQKTLGVSVLKLNGDIADELTKYAKAIAKHMEDEAEDEEEEIEDVVNTRRLKKPTMFDKPICSRCGYEFEHCNCMDSKDD